MPIIDKKQMTEEDIKLHDITPAIQAKWHDNITMETRITDGKINLRGNMVTRGKPQRVDYLLYLNANYPIAVVEAKDNNHSVSFGLQQAMDYAQKLDSIEQDFAPLDKTIRKINFAKDDKSTINAYEVYFALYQQTGRADDGEQGYELALQELEKGIYENEVV